MLKGSKKILLISILILAIAFPSYLSFVSSSSGNIRINSQGTSLPDIHVSAGGNVSLYFGDVIWNAEDFYLFITQDSSSAQLGSGVVYTPIFSVYDITDTSLTTHSGEYGGWRVGDNWVNGSIPSTTAPGNYYIKAADQIKGAVAVTDTYITVDPIAYNSNLIISPASGPGGVNVALTGSQWPAGQSVLIEYSDPNFGNWNLLKTLTASDFGEISTTLEVPDLKKSIGSYESPETYTSLSFRARTSDGAFSSVSTYNEYHRGLSQIGNLTSYGLFGNGTNLVSSIRVKDGDSLVIEGKWFHANSPIYIRWDSTTIVDTVSSNEWLAANIINSTVASGTTGSFSTTVTIPDAQAGEHYIAVEDSETRVIFKIFMSTGSLELSPASGPGGANVQFSGSGFPAQTQIDLYYMDPYYGQYYYWQSTNSSDDGTISLNAEIPDLAQTYYGDYNQTNVISFRANANGVPYAYADYTQFARGLQQVGTRVAYYLFGNNTDLTSSVSVKPGDSLFISGKNFHPSSIVYIKLDSINVIGTIYGTEWSSAQVLGSTTSTSTGSFQTSVSIPNAAGGIHSIAVEDSQSKLIIRITVDAPTSTPSPTESPSPTTNPTTNPTPTPSAIPVLPAPTIDLSCKSTSANEYKVEFNGQVTFNGNPLTDTPVFLSYSVNAGRDWTSLTLVNTGSDGKFIAVWKPDVTGNYLIKAMVEAAPNMNAASTIINLALTPDSNDQHNVFTLTSNSTITQFTFNPNDKELSFVASGPTNTHGYVDIYIPKTILSDISLLKAYIDGTEVSYTSQSLTDSWLISFSYSHSTHTITMSLAGGVQSDSAIPTLLLVAVAAVVVAVVAAVLVATRRKHKIPPPP